MLLGALLAAPSLCAQANTGELRLKVSDPAGLGVPTTVELISDANQVRRTLTTDDNGNAVAKRLAFGIYKIRVAKPGFVTFSEALEIRSVLPTPFRIKLIPAAVNASVIVKDVVGALIDPQRVGDINRIGSQTIRTRETSNPRAVRRRPGGFAARLVYEGNAVLHPRGSEYQTQFVVDGVPITDNRPRVSVPKSRLTMFNP